MLASPAVESGSFGENPYLRVGDGPGTLLVVPGLDDALFDGSYGRVKRRATAWALRRFAEEYTVYVVSRPRGLDPDASIEGMAREYVRVLEERLGPAPVMGISMGGLIAQEIARERPDLVDRLVLGVSGCRLAPGSREIGRRLRWYALEEDWIELRATLFEEMYTGRRRRLYPALARSVGKLRPPEPADPGDVVASIDATLAYDGCDRLGEIEPRTLVIGGDEDPFFPESILRETHEDLPDAQLALFRGGRHGALLERSEGFDGWTLDFLAGETARIDQV
ncbi:alpha/beta fold hydrolase [Saliphagus sp. LR7]|uniref:alpha/beta fold hydrolase n=1 Tax=Saliphagus sp. LR7 TaxID=2282654 RepID=UPI000DF822D9|nr:alpha/beta hydrolase [Saliphagus sp. LR7]